MYNKGLTRNYHVLKDFISVKELNEKIKKG